MNNSIRPTPSRMVKDRVQVYSILVYSAQKRVNFAWQPIGMFIIWPTTRIKTFVRGNKILHSPSGNFFFNRKWFSPPPSLSTTHFFMQKHWGKKFLFISVLFPRLSAKNKLSIFQSLYSERPKKEKRLMSRRRSIKTDFFFSFSNFFLSWQLQVHFLRHSEILIFFCLNHRSLKKL